MTSERLRRGLLFAVLALTLVGELGGQLRWWAWPQRVQVLVLALRMGAGLALLVDAAEGLGFRKVAVGLGVAGVLVLVPAALALPRIFPKAELAPEDPGEALYLRHCAACHGSDGVGGAGGPALADDRWLHPDPERVMREGAGTMPAYGEILEEEELRLIWAYVRALTPA